MAAGRQRDYRKGDTLIRVADTTQWAAVLLKGFVRVTNADGTQIITTRWTGDIVGELGVLDGQPRSATVRAEAPVRVLVLDGPDLNLLLTRLPRVLRELCTVLSERLRECEGIRAAQSGDALAKVVRFLRQSAVDRGQGTAIVHIGSQKALGDLIGVSRDSVVRALGRLREDNVVSTHRGLVTVDDPVKLCAYLAP